MQNIQLAHSISFMEKVSDTDTHRTSYCTIANEIDTGCAKWNQRKL